MVAMLRRNNLYPLRKMTTIDMVILKKRQSSWLLDRNKRVGMMSYTHNSYLSNRTRIIKKLPVDKWVKLFEFGAGVSSIHQCKVLIDLNSEIYGK